MDEDDIFRDVIKFNKRKNKSVNKLSLKDKLSRKSESSLDSDLTLVETISKQSSCSNDHLFIICEKAFLD